MGGFAYWITQRGAPAQQSGSSGAQSGNMQRDSKDDSGVADRLSTGAGGKKGQVGSTSQAAASR